MAAKPKKTEATPQKNEAMQLVRIAAAARKAAILVGSPGVGKTASVHALAESMGYELVTLVGSRMDPTDVVGLPKGEQIDVNGTPLWATVNLSPWWQVEILTKKKVILFFDEMGNTSPSTQAALLSFIQDRQFANGEMVPDETIILAATNPPEEGADGYEMSLPTTNRMVWIPFHANLQDWTKGMRNAWGKKVSADEMRWRSKIVRFIEDQPSNLHKMPEMDTPNPEVYGKAGADNNDRMVARSAWASPRSWDNVAEMLPLAGTTRLEDGILEGTVGASAAIQFREWLAMNDTVDPKEVIADPEGYDYKSLSTSEAYLLFKELPAMVTEENKDAIMASFAAVAHAGLPNLASAHLTTLFSALSKLRRNANAQQNAADIKKIAALATLYKEISESARR